MEGLTLGSYTVERELGRGGMGAVYSAVHTLLGRRAAVKVLLAELSRNQDLVQRFFNEARAATAIKHPSIVEIYDFGWAPDGSAYIVMELMEGESLATRLARQRRLPVAVALTVARQIANALAAAHRAGIVHRDLKPDNVFLVADVEVVGGERVKLLDFGIAKLAATGGVSRTTTGAIMGTPLYMSPEQCEGARHVDHRTDLYALGCILFEMIAGRPPFQSEGVGGLIGAHLHLPPPALRSVVADAPVEVEAIVARLLAKSPDDRYPRAEDVAAALGQLGGATTAPGVAAASAPSAFAPVAPAPAPSPSSASPPSGLASVPPPASLAVAATAPSTPPLVAVGVAATAASAPPPTTLSGSSGALPHTPAPWSPAAAMAPRPRRGRWLALGGVVVVVGAAIAVAAVTGGGGAAGTATPPVADAADLVVTADALAPLTATDAGAVAVVADLDAAAVVVVADADAGVDAAGADAGQALAEMQRARADRDWARLRLALDALYDATADGDPRRAQADAIIAEARPQAIAEARKAIEAASRRGACADATRIARDAIAAWGEDAAPLKKLAARCAGAHSGDERVSVDAGVGPPIILELPPVQIAARLRAETGRMRPCMAGADGPVRLALRIDIRPDGSVQGATASPADDRATCVERAVKTMRFPASVRGASAVVPIVVTPPPKPPPPTTGPIEGPQSPALKY